MIGYVFLSPSLSIHLLIPDTDCVLNRALHTFTTLSIRSHNSVLSLPLSSNAVRPPAITTTQFTRSTWTRSTRRLQCLWKPKYPRDLNCQLLAARVWDTLRAGDENRGEFDDHDDDVAFWHILIHPSMHSSIHPLYLYGYGFGGYHSWATSIAGGRMGLLNGVGNGGVAGSGSILLSPLLPLVVLVGNEHRLMRCRMAFGLWHWHSLGSFE